AKKLFGCMDNRPALLECGSPSGKWVGGLDFGFRNAFAAVWGVLDHDDVLWLTGELYGPKLYLETLAGELSKEIIWYADPAGARDRHELQRAGLKIIASINDRRLGMNAVNARITSGRLKIMHGTCPNLLAEAAEYRYRDRDDDGASETG